jgi:DNA invertase Pin-like site-specific DNA recombinase
MMIGYARVSTDDQNLALQLDALRAAGCEKIQEDKASGVLNGRKGLTEALKAALPVTCWWSGNSTGWPGRFTIWS